MHMKIPKKNCESNKIHHIVTLRKNDAATIRRLTVNPEEEICKKTIKKFHISPPGR